MQLPPSTFPIDPNLLAVFTPGTTSGAAPIVPAASGGPVTASFAELLPEAVPAGTVLDIGFEPPPVMIDAPLVDEQPELPMLAGQPMPFPRFVAVAPKISPEAPETSEALEGPVETAAGEREESPVPVGTDAKDKASKSPKAGTAPKRQGAIVAHPEKPRKEPTPELIFSAPMTALVALDLPTAPLAEGAEEGVAELPQLRPQAQPHPAISAPAKFPIRVNVPGAPALVARFALETETESAPAPLADSTPAPVSRETPRLPQVATQEKSQSSLPPTSQAPQHRPGWAARISGTSMQPIAETEVIAPAFPEPAPEPVLEERIQTPPSTLPAREQSPVWALRPLTTAPLVSASELAAPTLPESDTIRLPPEHRFPTPPRADHGKPQSSLPPTSRAVEHSPVWALRSLIAPQPVVAPVIEPATTNQPVSLSTAPAEVAPPSAAAATTLPSTPLSAERIEAAVAPAWEPILSPLSEATLPKTDLRARRENFAESADEFRVNFEPVEYVAQKIFVTAEGERLTQRSKTVGIGGAKSAATMPSRFSFTPTPHPAFEYAPAVAVASSDRAAQVIEAPAPLAASPEVANAHQAVEAVLRAVDHVATREQHSVNLHFSLGETELKVRVELRADEVRTTFSTDSAELRSALSHEWQAVAHSDASGSVRIAPATFTSDHSAATTFSGDASSRDRQQHQQANHGQNEFAQGRAGFGRSASFASTDAQPEVRPAARFVHAGSRHLSTLA